MCGNGGAVHSAPHDTEERMITHDVRVHPSRDNLQREDQLAWKIAGVAADKVAVDKDVTEMIANRIIDNAADYSHPGDNIPPILAVAQTMGKSGRDLVRGLATGYEILIDLVRSISLHKHRIEH